MQPIRRREQLSLSWISFSLKTLRLSPFGLAGVGFSLPGTPPVQKSANETMSGSRLFEHVVQVKALLDFFLAQSTPPELSLPLPPAYNNKCCRTKMRADFLCNTLNHKLFSAKICFSCKVLVILV